MRGTYIPIKIIASIVLIAALAIPAAAVTGWTDKQTAAHEIAELARGMGLPESDPIIVRAQEIWHEDEPERVYIGEYKITGYDTCAACCGQWAGGPTASGTTPTVGRTVAAKGLPFGTRIYIDGIGERVVEDRGVGEGVIDVLCADHAACYAITGRYDVWEVKR